MPQAMTKETTVYTLEELEDLGWDVREKAINNVLHWEWEGFEPSWFTEDLINDMDYHAPLFELQARTRHGKRQKFELEWDLDHLQISAKGSVDAKRFMCSQKLRNKYRALWYVMSTYGMDQSVGVQFGYGNDGADCEDLMSDIETVEGYEYQSPRWLKVRAQLVCLQDDIDGYIDDLHSKLLKGMRAEWDYRCSEEFAKEEIEALELKFTEEGAIYHG